MDLTYKLKYYIGKCYVVVEGRRGIIVSDVNFGIKYPIWVYLSVHISKSKGIRNHTIKIF